MPAPKPPQRPPEAPVAPLSALVAADGPGEAIDRIRGELAAPRIVLGSALAQLRAAKANERTYQAACTNLVTRGTQMDEALALAIRFVKGNATKPKAQVLVDLEAARKTWAQR